MGDANEIIGSAFATLKNAQLGADDFFEGPTTSRRSAGLQNVMVWGRAVTNVLQQLRSVDRTHFDAWYAPYRADMENNVHFKYLYQLRSQVLKEGKPPSITSGTYIGHLDSSQLAPLMQNPPPGATSFFIGDQLGGSGWEVTLPNGSTERYYVDLPPEIDITNTVWFADPSSAKGVPAPTVSVREVINEYLDYLGLMVSAAEAEF